MFKRLLHKLAHLFRYNTGKIISWSDGDFIYVAFECDCGKVDDSSINKIESDKVLNLWKKTS